MPRYAKSSARKMSKKRSTKKRVAFRKSGKGNGSYSLEEGPAARAGSYIGRSLGSTFGGEGGGKVGEWLGRRLFHYPAKAFGYGDYVVDTTASTNLAPQVPTFSKKGDYVCISHREYLGDLLSSSTANAFKIQKFGLNPSDSNTFPWLSQIAQPNFQQYMFESLIFEVRSFSADALNSTNTALGAVFSAVNYDYTDPDFSSRQEVENSEWAMSCKPSESMYVPVECEKRQTAMGGLMYIINGNQVPSGSDPKTYYLGKLFVGTTGFQGTNVNCGSIYVTYKIRLYKPLMTRPLSNALITSLFRTGVTNSLLFGDTTVSNVYNCDSVGVSIAGQVLTIDKTRLQVGQRFRLLYNLNGNSQASVGVLTLAFSSNATTLADQNNGFTPYAGNISWPVIASTTSAIIQSVEFMVNDNNSNVTITASLSNTNLPTVAALTVRLEQICGIPQEQIGFYTS